MNCEWGREDAFKRGDESTFIYWRILEALDKHGAVNNMHGWIKNLWKSRASLSQQHEQEVKGKKKSVSSVSSVSTSPSSTSPLRWSLKYDVFVCHSSVHSDIEEAVRLVSFLEDSPRSLRCFLMQRDACPGGAISTELCQALQDSHLRALLITPYFLQDDWCKYMMHQVLSEGPMTNRIIPLLKNLSHSQYPQELRFYFYIDLSRNPDWGYTRVNKTVLKYLEDLIKNEKTLDCHMDSSSSEPSGESSAKTDKPMSTNESAETSIPLKVIEKRDESFSGVD